MAKVSAKRGHVRGGRRQGEDAGPARVMVFAADEEAARQAASPLRSALWGDHKVSVLLPQGEEPIQVSPLRSPRVVGSCLPLNAQQGYKQRARASFQLPRG